MDEKLAELWAKSSNAPKPQRAPVLRPRELAIIHGIGPVIAEQIKAVRDENAALKQENAALRADLVKIGDGLAEMKAGLAQQKLKIADMLERFGLSAEDLPPPTRRLLS